jgi:hypothetical protein
MSYAKLYSLRRQKNKAKQSQFAGQWPEIRKFESVRLKNKPNVNMGKIVQIRV